MQCYWVAPAVAHAPAIAHRHGFALGLSRRKKMAVDQLRMYTVHAMHRPNAIANKSSQYELCDPTPEMQSVLVTASVVLDCLLVAWCVAIGSGSQPITGARDCFTESATQNSDGRSRERTESTQAESGRHQTAADNCNRRSKSVGGIARLRCTITPGSNGVCRVAWRVCANHQTDTRMS